jgi:hypothetical protein
MVKLTIETQAKMEPYRLAESALFISTSFPDWASQMREVHVMNLILVCSPWKPSAHTVRCIVETSGNQIDAQRL